MGLEQIQRGKVNVPRRTLLYGVHGVGKSTFGALAEAPIFIQTEDGLTNIDCQRLPLATNYADSAEEAENGAALGLVGPRATAFSDLGRSRWRVRKSMPAFRNGKRA